MFPLLETSCNTENNRIKITKRLPELIFFHRVPSLFSILSTFIVIFLPVCRRRVSSSTLHPLLSFPNGRLPFRLDSRRNLIFTEAIIDNDISTGPSNFRILFYPCVPINFPSTRLVNDTEEPARSQKFSSIN